MNIWYSITPVDTLFLRGAEPMEAGQPSREALFPPPVSVIAGALRTAALKQRGIAFADYKAGKCPDDLIEAIGPCGGPAPFQVGAVLLARGEAVYAPCPAHWFAESEELKDYRKAKGGQATLTIRRAAPLPQNAVEHMRPHTSAGADLPVVRAGDAKSLAGHWLRLHCLDKAALAAGDLLAASDLYDVEHRTGIAIDAKRRVKEGAIYSAAHIRLRPDAHLLVGLDREPGLTKDRGTLALGGEQRVCGYEQCEGPDLPQTAADSAALHLALAPVELTEDFLPHIFAAAKPVTLAGWDLARGFHKATTTWLSAGSVFTKNINNLCIPLAQ